MGLGILLRHNKDIDPMDFYSILFEKAQSDIKKETPEAPVFFADLNLDQIIDAITTGKEEYHLKPFFPRG
jgi:hypothetical protein